MKLWTQTYTGVHYTMTEPSVADVNIRDIAHALSMQCRFNGHTEEFYSVAQHSVLVSHVASNHPLWGLLHDASEAYIGDIITPVKRSIDGIRDIEQRNHDVIAIKFGLDRDEPEAVKRADLVVLATEVRDLMGGQRAGDWEIGAEPLSGITIQPVGPALAKKMFLSRFEELSW
jgi:5'-deoxynucleotidase YfbR-like HD superfamily hydrolase